MIDIEACKRLHKNILMLKLREDVSNETIAIALGYKNSRDEENPKKESVAGKAFSNSMSKLKRGNGSIFGAKHLSRMMAVLNCEANDIFKDVFFEVKI